MCKISDNNNEGINSWIQLFVIHIDSRNLRKKYMNRNINKQYHNTA